MIVALNNKSNLTVTEFKEYYKNLVNVDTKGHELILCPSFLNIPLADAKEIKLGSQNVSKSRMGAYTGEVSATQLLDANVEYCLVGHSERRKFERVTNDDINKKIKLLLEVGITPILCIGETEEERNNNIYIDVLMTQIEEALLDIDSTSSIIIAYEPVWSIGTGKIPTNDQITNVFESIKEVLPNNKILYGGSANEENIETLKEVTLIDGYLLGGLSLKPEKLEQFLKKL